ncbi:hypothetical protein P691DRAFT_764194 [Macrolepiota fuliginosa MF-IS2]|uniref:NACHT domain-containing protein n=1 Tax=Macrolepiota fuliginosa MF-IS2 TaxID=1400762 RepID=A0A9P6BZF9_9AGAR|nr:hypothetical protein P691DRAFT_764194 [Macrolepiota fuliginosa MF-IS2]
MAKKLAKFKGVFGGLFKNAHHFTIRDSTMIGNAENVNFVQDNRSIELLAKEVIPGAAFDSRERYPPPHCHPGTRLGISMRIQSWVYDHARINRVIWLHGPAGVGKSAIIQTLAESNAPSEACILGAAIFFSKTNDRDDPQRVFITIAYQLAVRYAPYRRYITDLLITDPNVVRKSLTEQFKWFITILVVLDGLDECDGEEAQGDIVLLIGRFALNHPASPLIWIIASRPEPHIQAAFSHDHISSSYMEVDVPVNSTDACADVERYLRHELDEIRRKYSSLFSPTQNWPTEMGFSIIAKSSSGLFAFASVVVRFIGDANYDNPISQLRKVLAVIGSTSSSMDHGNPFATLDALYTEILAGIPREIFPVTRSLLMTLLLGFSSTDFHFVCNWIGLNQADAYGALRRLHSVLDIPLPEQAHKKSLKPCHASFIDYLSTPSRSGLFYIDPSEPRKMVFSKSLRILLESHNAAEASVDAYQIDLVFRPHLEEWGVVQTVPIESLDLNDVRLSEQTYIINYKNRAILQSDSTQGDLEWDGLGYGKLVLISDFTDMGEWSGMVGREKVLPLGQDSRWKDLVWRNPTEMQDVIPSYPIMMFGKGNKSCALIAAGTPGEFWVYGIPCCQSQSGV